MTKPTTRYELINEENAQRVADMLLWAAERFTMKDVEISGVSTRELRWEMVSSHHLNIFLEECIDEGLHAVNCFGHIAEHRGYPIHVPENVVLPEGLANELWDGFSFIMEVGINYWDTCVNMYEDMIAEERKQALKNGIKGQ